MLYMLGYIVGFFVFVLLVTIIVDVCYRNKKIERHSGILFFRTKPNCVASIVASVISLLSSVSGFIGDEVNYAFAIIPVVIIAFFGIISFLAYRSFR